MERWTLVETGAKGRLRKEEKMELNFGKAGLCAGLDWNKKGHGCLEPSGCFGYKFVRFSLCFGADTPGRTIPFSFFVQRTRSFAGTFKEKEIKEHGPRKMYIFKPQFLQNSKENIKTTSSFHSILTPEIPRRNKRHLAHHRLSPLSPDKHLKLGPVLGVLGGDVAHCDVELESWGGAAGCDEADLGA